MVYLDNAATGGFKISAVTDAAQTVLKYLSANPGRSGHRLSLAGAELVSAARGAVADMFNANPDRVIFTKNCTEALNIAIFGSLKVGGHVITTVFEHNSVLRPLFTLKNKGLIELDVVSLEENKPLYLSIEEKIKDNTYMIVSTSVNNVSGYELPVEQIGVVAKKHALHFLVDGAQGGGHIPLDMKKQNITMLALAGHKGLGGIMGSGVLIIDDDTNLEPLLYGGTGSETFNFSQPDCYPERLEAGTLNLPAIAALNEGVRFINDNLKNFSVHLLGATKSIISGLNQIENAECFSSPNRTGIVAFRLKNLPSSEVSDILNTDYDIAVRGGLHCAPLTHKYLGTDKDGLIRVSVAVQNSSREISYLLKALTEIAKR